jgi:hypothetical protein
MFNTRGPDGIPDSLYHIAHTALLGPPPLDFLERSGSERRQEFYNSKGGCRDLSLLRTHGSLLNMALLKASRNRSAILSDYHNR